MSPRNSTSTRKRGRPPKYQSAEERQAAKVTRQRNQRQAAQAAKRNTVFDEYYSAGPSTTGDRPIAHVAGLAAWTVSNELDGLLPPLSPEPPLELEGRSIPVDEPPLELNSLEAAASPPPDRPFRPTHCEHLEGHLSNLESRGPALRTPEDRDDICTLARALADQLYQHHGCCRECHEQARMAHQETHSVHTGLGEYVDQNNIDGDFPDESE